MSSIIPYSLLPNEAIVPFAYVPKPEIKFPMTQYSAKNYIGRRLLLGPQHQLGDPIIIPDIPKNRSDQYTMLIVGPRATGKTVLIRVLIENAWFNNFTPIFVISPKNDYVNMDKPNIKDIKTNLEHHREWLYFFIGEDVWPKDERYRKEKFLEAFRKHKFKVKILVPPMGDIKDERYEKYRLNPRLLDVYQIADLIGRPAESIYLKIYDSIYTRLWAENPRMTFAEFMQKFVRIAKERSKANPQFRTMIRYIHNSLMELYEKGYISNDGRNTLLKYFREKTIVNFTLHEQARTIQNVVLVSNFITQILELVQRYKLSSLLVIDDVAFFLTSIGAREKSRSMNRILDELINIQGRVAYAGVRLIFAYQSMQQIPKKLRDKSIYTHIFLTKPSKGFIRIHNQYLETEMIDNIGGVTERILIRTPVTARGE